MNAKPQKLHLRFKFWIETDASVSVLGEGKWQLLKAIKETGSLKAAVEKMGYSYRQTWQNLKNIEERLGFKLIEKQRGGKMGGKTILTPKGEKIVRFFDKLYNDREPELLEQFDKVMDDLNKIIE